MMLTIFLTVSESVCDSWNGLGQMNEASCREPLERDDVSENGKGREEGC